MNSPASSATSPIWIAYSVDGASLGSSGFARLIVPNDVKAGRWISNLVSLEVFTATPVPEPSSAGLMAIGLLGLVGVATRRENVPRLGRV